MRALIVFFIGLALTGCGPDGGDTAHAPDKASARAPAAPLWRIAPADGLNAFFDCLDETGASIVAAHRGGPRAGFPENALETFENTLAGAPALIEIDVAQSADGVLYLMHDETLARATNGEGRVNARPWREIAALRLKDPTGAVTDYAPARLDAVLAWAEGRTILELDIKSSARYEAVAEAVRRQNAERRVILIAYSLAQAKKLHRLLPETMISLSIETHSALNAAVAAAAPSERLIAFTGLDAPDPRLFDSLEARNVEIVFGTLGGRDSLDAAFAERGDDRQYAALAAIGVDIIATDRPLAADAALREAGRAVESGECAVTRG